jgi:Ni,Fe-hydrogenase III small subunit/formate hydrogenlyase subunit 6/NADH:ubiquinone oxidoreductase subunit I
MIKVILARLFQGHRTMKYPAGAPPAMPDRFRGKPVIARSKCPADCRACADACPVGAIDLFGEGSVDLGKCLFCVDCGRACPAGAVGYSGDYRLAFRRREDLVRPLGEREAALVAALEKKTRKLFGRSLKLRQVSAGGCNACEADVNVLGTVAWDLGRFGIQMVASPRHADGILVTGPVSRNMELALKKTYDAVPDPKIVIAVGSCAVAGGPYIDSAEAAGGAVGTVPVDLFIPGCPPHPLTILDGMLRLLGKIESGRKK